MAKSIASCCGVPAGVTSHDLDRWTDNVMNVLDSPRARKKFHDFLSFRSMDDAESTLHFWEECNRLLLEVSHDAHLKRASHLQSGSISHDRFRSNYSKLVEFAVENINFDSGQVRLLRQALNSNNPKKMLNTIERAQHSAANLLSDEFSLFRKVLLKDYKASIEKHK